MKWWPDAISDPRIRQGEFADARHRQADFGFCLVAVFLVQQRMASWEHSNLFAPLLGEVVVVDMRSTFVCLGTLVSCDSLFLEFRDADLHDFRDSPATREVYVYDSVRLGIHRNRARVLIRLDDVVAVTRFSDIADRDGRP